MKLVAKTFGGLEPILAEELKQIGAENINPLTGAVEFEGDKRVLYRANLELRTALRILYPIASFRARNEEHLQESIYDIEWSRYMKKDDTLAIDVVSNTEYFKSNGLIAMKTKDAIAEQFRSQYGERPSIDTIRPTLRIHLAIIGEECEVALDSSSDSLAKRGFDYQELDNATNAVLAAGMILMSGWKGERDFIDPMCGTGVILTEAAMIAYNIPPMLHREFWSFKKWSNFDKPLWEEILATAKSNIKSSINAKILGFDAAFQPVRVCERNIQAVGLEGKITVVRLAFEKQNAYQKPVVLLSNPPFDEDMKESASRVFYKNVGEILKKKFIGSEAWFVSQHPELGVQFGFEPSAEFELSDEDSDYKIIKYEKI